MFKSLAQLVQRSAVVVLLLLTVAAIAGFAAVGHLVTRYNLNQQSRGRKLYAQGEAEVEAGDYDHAIEAFRAALISDHANPQYQLSLARALRDTGRLDEAETYLQSLWERDPESGTINLALARVAARRGNLEAATRYYHNAMYGEWTGEADNSRRKARFEFIEFLLQRNVLTQARSELVALAAILPPGDPDLHLRTAQLFAVAQDYSEALSEYERVLRLDRGNAAALAGAGQVSYLAGHYRTAERYLQAAVNVNPNDSNSRSLLATATTILQIDPFVRRISDAERNRRIAQDFAEAGARLTACAQQKGINLSVANVSLPSAGLSPLALLNSRWLQMQHQLPHLRSPDETDLPDAIMDLVFQIEQETTNVCGAPQGVNEALLLISRNREDADQ
ncbi:MAG TPA: tetratricopeptide repeat protein [Verrucomicrobiae bacterium]|jgi:tetratricopeptide (TPR) repeat protein|nr:tetratricopeptide repeat protein [Verrucomicrobiae bacterium]